MSPTLGPMDAKHAMPNRTDHGSADSPPYRNRQADGGMRQRCVSVPNPSPAESTAEAKRNSMLLRGRPEEAEATDFITRATEWPDP